MSALLYLLVSCISGAPVLVHEIDECLDSSVSLLAVDARRQRATGKHSKSAARCIANYADSLDQISSGLGTHIRQIQFNHSSRSQKNIVFGAGSGTTATTGLHQALKQIGLTGWHFEIDADWVTKLEETIQAPAPETYADDVSSDARIEACHRSLNEFDYTTLPSDIEYVLDEPVDVLLVHLLSTFPNAKFILTTRESLEWARRRREHPHSLAPLQDPCGLFITDFPSDSILAQLEDLKRDFARCIIPKHQLLEFDIWNMSKERNRTLMRDIAAFVGHPLAEDLPFPDVALNWQDS